MLQLFPRMGWNQHGLLLTDLRELFSRRLVQLQNQYHHSHQFLTVVVDLGGPVHVFLGTRDFRFLLSLRDQGHFFVKTLQKQMRKCVNPIYPKREISNYPIIGKSLHSKNNISQH